MNAIVVGLIIVTVSLLIDAGVLIRWWPDHRNCERRRRICIAAEAELGQRRCAGHPLDTGQLARLHVVTSQHMVRHMDPLTETDTDEIIGRIADADDDRLIGFCEWCYGGSLVTG